MSERRDPQPVYDMIAAFVIWGGVDGIRWAEGEEGLTPLQRLLVPALVLRRLGDPARLEEQAENLARIGAGPRDVARSRFYAKRARWAKAEIETAGGQFDFERGDVLLPSGSPGRPRELATEAVGRAFDELGLAAGEHWYTPAVYAPIRKRLSGWLEPEELTDTLIKRRLQTHKRASERRK